VSMLNVVVAGAKSVGKNTIVNLLDAEQTLDTVSSRVKLTIQICRVQELLQMFNRGRNIYKNSDFLLLVYDISSIDSFKEIDSFYTNYLTYGNRDATSGIGGSSRKYKKYGSDNDFPVLLLGNKLDLDEKRAVFPNDVTTWCKAKRPTQPIQYAGE
jgi:GTPase SAR1 family protein